MKYWIDTEFIERPCTIDLISIGLVAEDGREFYAESSEVDWTKASQWTLETVRPQLDGKGMTREDIGYAFAVSSMPTNIRCSGDISRPMTGSRSAGCSATWTNFRSGSRSFVWTPSSGPSSWVTLSCRTRWAPATTPLPTHGGRGTYGRFSQVSIRLLANDALSARRTRISGLPGQRDRVPEGAGLCGPLISRLSCCHRQTTSVPCGRRRQAG